VIVDVSVPGGRWIDNIIYDSSSEADRAAAKMRTPWWKARRVQVIDAVWYGPAEARLQATGMRASRGRRAHPIYEHTTSLHHTPAFYLADQLLQGTTPPKGRTWETPQERTLRRLYMAKEEAHRSTSDMRGGSEIPDELWEQAEREIDRRIARVSLAIGKLERKGTTISGRGRRARDRGERRALTKRHRDKMIRTFAVRKGLTPRQVEDELKHMEWRFRGSFYTDEEWKGVHTESELRRALESLLAHGPRQREYKRKSKREALRRRRYEEKHRGRRAAPLTAGTMSMFKEYRFKVRPVKGADNTLERRFTLKAMPGGWLFQRKGYGVKRLNKGKADVLIEASDFLGRER
jgi:hypothetical protein